MRWFYDPFKSFLLLYGVLLILGIGLLYFAKSSAERWYSEQSAQALLEGEVANLEVIWYIDGLATAREYMLNHKSKIFKYEFHHVSKDNVPRQYFEEGSNEPITEFPSKEYLLADVQVETDTHIALTVYFDYKSDWYKITVTI